MNVMRGKLMASYEGLLDPNRPPHMMLDPLPVLRIYRYDDVVAALSQPEFSHQILPGVPTHMLNLILSGSVVQPLGERHDRLRQAVTDFITPEVVRNLNQFIVDTANALVSRAVAQGKAFNLATLTDRLTYEVICELLGAQELKTDARRTQFFKWMDELTAVTSPLKMPRQADVRKFITEYMEWRLDKRQNKPIDHLFRSSEFSDQDKKALWYLLMTSATITTSYTMCAAWTLLKTMDSPDVFARIRHNATQESGNLLMLAYMEALRSATPSRCRVVRVRQSTTLPSGRHLAAGRFVDVCFSSANRDSRFTDPHVYNPERPPKPAHIGFGVGPYKCPGSGLSGTESRAMLAALFRHAPGWQIADVVPGGRLILRMNQLILQPPRK